MTDAMHISSLIVHVRPDRFDAVQKAIEDAGGEIPASDPSGKLVVVVETDEETAVTAFADRISDLPGVIGAALVFHHIDEPEPRPAADARDQRGDPG